jgi:LPXTG-motif cell wall-anchored protein
MKKSVLAVSIMLLLIVGLNRAMAQEQPKPKKDTVNMDTDAKPTFYYPVEDEKSNAKKGSGNNSVAIVAIIAGAVVLVGGAGFVFLRKKNK